MTTLYDFTVSDQADQPVSLNDYKGKVVLIVNTATGCGLTPQYQGLQELYDKYIKKTFIDWYEIVAAFIPYPLIKHIQKL